MQPNRRAHPRYETSLSAEINTGSDVLMALAKNLSLGGVGLALQSPLAEKSLVGISLFLVEEGIEDEATATLNVQGQVVWLAPVDAGGYEAGIHFAPLAPPQTQLLQHYLARLSEQP